MAQTTFITGQHVCIRQTAATILQRIIAIGIDLFVLLFVATSLSSAILRSIDYRNDLYYLLNTILIVFAISYPLWMEFFFNGQTLGKMIMKIRVVCLDGSHPSFSALMLRWALLVLELPSALGVIFIIFTKNSQRIGDLAAGTAVVKVSSQKVPQIMQYMKFTSKYYTPTYPEASNLSTKQVEVMGRVLFDYSGINREKYLEQLAVKLEKILDIKAKSQNAEDFVSTLFNDFNYYATRVM